jgi:tetratricopeptide (TPR) repeat protein
MRRLVALGLALAFLFPLAGRAAAEEPVFLMVPLLSPPQEEEWLSRTLDRILEEQFRDMQGLAVAGGEDRKAALVRLAKEPQIGPDELVEAMDRGGATHAVVGQFTIDGDVISLDLRLFAAQEEKQTAAFREEAFLDETFSLMADAARMLAVESGAVVAEDTERPSGKPPTPSLRAYYLYTSARAETDGEKRLALFKEAIEADPSYFDANQSMGLTLYQMGRAEEALPYLHTAARVGKEIAEAHNNLAVIYAQLGRKEEALAAFEKALELRSDYPEALLNYGRLLEEHKRFDEAERVYADLLDGDPDNVKARSSLALLYERTGRTELAIQEYRILSRKTPELAENYFLRSGRQARKAGEYGKAEKYFLRAVDVNPQLAQGYAELGINAYFAGHHQKSMEYFRQALSLEPQRGEYHHYLGLAQEKSGERKESRVSFRRSVELGGPLESRVSLARIYLADGETNRAIDELNLILDEDPAQEEAKEMLSRALDRAEAEQMKEQQRADFATHRLERLEVIIEQLNRTNRELENRLFSLQSGRQEMERELEQLRAEKAEREAVYGGRMEEAIRSIEQLSDDKEFEKLRQEYLAQVQDLKEQLAEKEGVLQEALTQLESTGGGEASAGESRALLRERKKRAALEEELVAVRKKLRDLEKNEREREGAVKGLQKRVDRLQADRLEEGKELSALKERSRAQADRVEELQKELEKTEGQLEKAREESQELRTEDELNEKEAEELRQKTEALRSSREDLERELAELRRGHRDLTVKAEELERELEEQRIIGDSVREKEEEAEELRRRESAALGEVERLRRSVADLETRLEESRREYEAILSAEREQHSNIYRVEKEVREAYERVRRELLGQALELGTIHMRNRSWEKAGLYLQRAVELDPRNAKAYYSLGEVYFQLGRFELSKEMYQKAREVY